MRPSVLLSSFIWLLLLVTNASGRGDGAPLSTCETMFPKHGVEPQSSKPPYQLLPSKGQGRIRLLIGSPEGFGYGGFIIMARDNRTGEIIGEFNNLPDSMARYLECEPGQKVSFFLNFSSKL